MIRKILNSLYYMLFFLTPLVMYPATSEIFEFNKMLFIYFSTTLISFFWVMRMILDRKIILKKTPLDVPIILFLGAMVLSTVFSIDVHTSLFGYYGRFNGGLVSIFSYVILYYGFISNEVSLKKSLLWSLFSSVFVILWGLPGKIGRDLTCPAFNTILTSMSGNLNPETLNSIWTTKFNNSCWSRETNVFDPASRMFSTLGQPNWLGAYLAITFFIGIYFFVKNRQNWKYLALNILYLGLNFSAILFTRSRSAMTAVSIGMIVIFAYFLTTAKSKSIARYLTGLVILLLAPIIIFKTGISAIDNIIDRAPGPVVKQEAMPPSVVPPPTESGITESFDIRKVVWKGAIDLGFRYPLFGTGPETFAYSYFFTRPIAHNMTSEWDFIYNKAHNEYLNYFATTGLAGLISYLAFMVIFSVYVFRASGIVHKSGDGKAKENFLAVSLYTAWLTILITNFFGFSTTTINIFFYLIPAFIIAGVNGESEPGAKSRDRSNSNPVLQGTAIFVSSAVAIYVLFSIGTYFVADINYGQGVYYSKPQVNDFQKAAFYFQEALRYRREHVYEDKLAYALAYLSGIAAYQKNDEVAGQFVTASEYYSVKSLKSSPKNVLYWKTLAKNKYLHYLTNHDQTLLDEGIEALREAEKLSPTDPRIPYSLAVFYSIKYDLEKDQNAKSVLVKLALFETEKSIILKGDFYDGYFFKGQFQKKTGDAEDAKKTFQYILKNINPKDNASIQELESL